MPDNYVRCELTCPLDDCIVTMMDKFFLPCNDCDPGYIAVRDLDCLSEDKEFVEQLWSVYEPYADRHFRKDSRLHFQERFWEMYLGSTFLDNQYKLDRHSGKGPEFYLYINGSRHWVEAIAPGPGEGPDAVPEMEHGKPIATRVPSDEIILRLRHAIYEKHKKFLLDLECGIIKEDEPYVLAINSKKIRQIISDPEVPLIVKAVFPFGNLIMVFDKTVNGIVDSYHEYRDSVEKKEGSSVTTDIFLSQEYSGISAVIYSSVDAVNRPKKFGSDFRILHNKMSNNPIPLGTFKFGVEYWVEDDELKSKTWG